MAAPAEPTVRLMNAAVMPCEGKYQLIAIDADSFGKHVCYAHECGKLVSYVGYANTAALISRLSCVTIPVTRQSTELNDGDTMLICRLKYRADDPTQKRFLNPSDDDYEFFVAFYRKS